MLDTDDVIIVTSDNRITTEDDLFIILNTAMRTILYSPSRDNFKNSIKEIDDKYIEAYTDLIKWCSHGI